jgi:hypothetical protein
MDELATRTWDELRPERDKGSKAQALTLPESQVLLELTQAPASEWWDDRRTPDVVETRDAIICESSARGARSCLEEARRSVARRLEVVERALRQHLSPSPRFQRYPPSSFRCREDHRH